MQRKFLIAFLFVISCNNRDSDNGYIFIVHCRLPQSDAATQRAVQEIFSGDAIRVNLAFLDQIKKLFVEYLHLNLNGGKNKVGWKDVEDKNIAMVARSFLKMSRYLYLIPHMIDIDTLQTYI